MAASSTSVHEAVARLNSSKLTAHSNRATAQRKAEALAEVRLAAGRGFLPSGPRAKGVGCEDEEQGIMLAEATESGGAKLLVSLLAAGFVIGPSGASIREICKQTAADVRSFNDKYHGATVRCMLVEGRREAVVQALKVIVDAVAKYKSLTEGDYAGYLVDRVQLVSGCQFYYSPPPRAAVPYAAALKSPADRSIGPVKVLDLSPRAQDENSFAAVNDATLAAAAAQQVFLQPGLPTLHAGLCHTIPTGPPAVQPLSQMAGELLDVLRPTQLAGTPLTPARPPTKRLALERAAACDLDQVLRPIDLDRLAYSAQQPSYSLFGAGGSDYSGPTLFDGATLALPQPQDPQLDPFSLGGPASTLPMMPTPAQAALPGQALPACAFPSFSSFAQQSPHYADPATASIFQPAAASASPWAALPAAHRLPAGQAAFQPW